MQLKGPVIEAPAPTKAQERGRQQGKEDEQDSDPDASYSFLADESFGGVLPRRTDTIEDGTVHLPPLPSPSLGPDFMTAMLNPPSPTSSCGTLGHEEEDASEVDSCHSTSGGIEQRGRIRDSYGPLLAGVTVLPVRTSSLPAECTILKVDYKYDSARPDAELETAAYYSPLPSLTGGSSAAEREGTSEQCGNTVEFEELWGLSTIEEESEDMDDAEGEKSLSGLWQGRARDVASRSEYAQTGNLPSLQETRQALAAILSGHGSTAGGTLLSPQAWSRSSDDGAASAGPMEATHTPSQSDSSSSNVSNHLTSCDTNCRVGVRVSHSSSCASDLTVGLHSTASSSTLYLEGELGSSGFPTSSTEPQFSHSPSCSPPHVQARFSDLGASRSAFSSLSLAEASGGRCATTWTEDAWLGPVELSHAHNFNPASNAHDEACSPEFAKALPSPSLSSGGSNSDASSAPRTPTLGEETDEEGLLADGHEPNFQDRRELRDENTNHWARPLLLAEKYAARCMGNTVFHDAQLPLKTRRSREAHEGQVEVDELPPPRPLLQQQEDGRFQTPIWSSAHNGVDRSEGLFEPAQ